MAGSLPKARRVGGVNTQVIIVLAVAVAALVGLLVWMLLGGSLFNGEPASDLERDYQLLLKGLAANPKDPSTLMTLAEVEYDLGKKADAFDHAEKSLDNSAEQPYFHLRYATLLVRDDRLDDATKALQREIEITGTTKAEPYFLLAQIQAEKKLYDEAIKTMQQGLTIDVTAADMGIVYGQILEQAGRKDDAVDAYQKALKFLPGDEEAIAGLKRLGVEYEEPTSTVDPHSGATSTIGGQ